MLTLLLVGCSDTLTLTGKVQDIWGVPVGEATVVIEGVVERHYADAAGVFQIEVDHPVRRLMAGKDGFIKDVLDVPALAEDADYEPMTFELYPEPEAPGFFGIGASAYIPVGAQRISMVGTELRHYTGLRDVPDDPLPVGNGRFVFTSRLRESELLRMNLHLSRLEFVSHVPVKGVFGRMEATVNLWTAAEEVAFDLVQLPSRDDFLLTTRERLAPGMYAFHAQDVLNEPDERVFLMLPKEMQVAFPFEIGG